MKKKLLTRLLTLTLLVLPLALPLSQTAKASEIFKTFSFANGKTLNAGATEAYPWISLKKGQKVHVVATSNGSFTIGISKMTTLKNYGVSCGASCNKYITVPADGYYRVFLYNAGSKKATVKGHAYCIR